jgi:uncharacterized protein YwgA
MQLDFFTDPANQLPHGGERQFVEPGWIALAEVVRRIGAKRHHWPVGRVRLQKVAYFLTALGVPTKLQYRRGSYGPYSPDLKAVESRLLNNGLLTSRRLGQMIEFQAGPTLDDAVKAYSPQLEGWEDEIDRVTDLCERLITTQSEVAASVHLVANELHSMLGRIPSDTEVREEVLHWKARRPLTPEEVQASVESMALLKWIEVEPTRSDGDEPSKFEPEDDVTDADVLADLLPT